MRAARSASRAAPRARRRRTGRRGWPRRARAGSVFGSPCSRILPRERNSTRSQTASTSYMLWLVHSTPQWPASTSVGDAGADVAGGGGVDRGGRLVEQQQPRAVEHRLGQRQPGLLAGRQHARPWSGGSASRSNCSSSSSIRAVRSLDRVDHAEDAQVLLDGQIAGQRRVDGGEVGARPARGCGRAPGRRPRSRCAPRWARARRGSC